MFWSKDHQENHILVEKAIPAAREAGVDLTKPSVRDCFIHHYNKMKLDLITSHPNLPSSYQLVQEDQSPDFGTMFGSWLIQNQAKTVANDKMVMLNFNAPIEFEALMIPNSIV